MDFFWGDSEGNNYAEKEVWKALELALSVKVFVFIDTPYFPLIDHAASPTF